MSAINFHASKANFFLLQYLNTCWVYDEKEGMWKGGKYHLASSTAFSASVDLKTSGRWIVAGGETSDYNNKRWDKSKAMLKCGE